MSPDSSGNLKMEANVKPAPTPLPVSSLRSPNPPTPAPGRPGPAACPPGSPVSLQVPRLTGLQILSKPELLPPTPTLTSVH